VGSNVPNETRRDETRSGPGSEKKEEEKERREEGMEGKRARDSRFVRSSGAPLEHPP